MSEIAIRVDHISKAYTLGSTSQLSLRETLLAVFERNIASKREQFKALNDVSFDIKWGETVGIIGKNGAGKSTILKILSRITKPSNGRIETYGKVASLLEVGTGFHPELTGRENVYLNGTLFGMSKREIDTKFEEIIDFSGIEKFIDTPVKRYSSGMYVRLAFAVAAHLEPEILIVDEVLAVGDTEFQKKCIGKMDEVSKKKGKTVLFVSHNMGIVSTLCSRGILLENGEVKFDGSIKDCVKTYQNSILQSLNIPLVSIKDRSGNSNFTFVNAILVDEHGIPIYSIKSGQNVRLLLDVLCEYDGFINDTQIDIGLNDITGTPLAWLSTYYSGNSIKIKKGLNNIVVSINKLPLVPGNFKFTFYGKMNGEIADWIKDCYSFDVISGDFYQNEWHSRSVHGMFLLDHSFAFSY